MTCPTASMEQHIGNTAKENTLVVNEKIIASKMLSAMSDNGDTLHIRNIALDGSGQLVICKIFTDHADILNRFMNDLHIGNTCDTDYITTINYKQLNYIPQFKSIKYGDVI